MTRSAHAWSCASCARARVPWCCWIEPNSVDACALICIRRCCAASSGRSFGASAFAAPLRSPTSICVGISSAILAQRQNGSSFGKKRSHSSASFGKSGKLCRCQCSMASWYCFGSVRTSSFTSLAYRVWSPNGHTVRGSARTRRPTFRQLEQDLLVLRVGIVSGTATLHDERASLRRGLTDGPFDGAVQGVRIGPIHVPDALALTELVAIELADARFLDRSFDPLFEVREALALRGSAEPRLRQP